MPADPQQDPRFEDGLASAFSLAAENVTASPEALVTGGLARGRTRRRRRRLAAVAGGVTALAVIGAGGGILASSLTTPLPTSNALEAATKDAPRHLDHSVNILLIGLDSRKDMDGNDLPKQFVQDQLHAGSSDIGGYNTGTLLVLHIPADGGRVQAVSIPRDDWVQTYGADGRMHQVKEAYNVAKAVAETKLKDQGLSKADLEHRGREAGRAATIQTVQHLLNIPIDHFAEVNLLGFYDIAKTVQPITVCLDNPVNDPIEPRATDADGNVVKAGGGTGLTLPAGQSQLDASEALSFVRQRHHLPNGDLDRTHRQQAFIASVAYKLKQEGVLGDPKQLTALFDAVKKDVVIDNQWNIVDFAQQVPDLTGGNVEFNTLPIDSFGTKNGQDVNIVDPAELQKTVQQLFDSAATPAPSAPDTAAPKPPGVPLQGRTVHGGAIPCVD
jgi:LCP family protein required for cell wall assembly